MSEHKAGNQGRSLHAAALRYRAGEDQAPVVVAAGAGHTAQRIVEIAGEHGIAVYHDDTAATLLSKLNLGQEVPGELYGMVVDIYLTVLAAAKSAKEDLGLRPSPQTFEKV